MPINRTPVWRIFYKQISGTPMGSPLSSFLAEAVMQDLEHQVLLNNTEVNSGTATWTTYFL